MYLRLGVFTSEGYIGVSFCSTRQTILRAMAVAVLFSAANVRVVLEVHDIDPANPGSLVRRR